MAKAFEGLGRALSLLRTERRLSQRRLAELSGINKSLISRYERGHVEPTFESVNRLLDAMGANRRDLDAYLTRVQGRGNGGGGEADGEVLGGLPPEAYLVVPLRPGPGGLSSETAERQLGKMVQVIRRCLAEPG